MFRILTGLLALIAFALPQAAAAQVTLSFHSFNGSMFGGRFPHTFIVLQGTLEATGQAVNENYGYTAIKLSPAILSGNVAGTVMEEKPKYLTTTNRHFSIPISDEQYHRIIAEMQAWRDAPGKVYNLDRHNCVHFVARMAELAGLTVQVPENMVRRPKLWLNFVTRLNPQLGVREIP
jgi:hypothetical protein